MTSFLILYIESDLHIMNNRLAFHYYYGSTRTQDTTKVKYGLLNHNLSRIYHNSKIINIHQTLISSNTLASVNDASSPQQMLINGRSTVYTVIMTHAHIDEVVSAIKIKIIKLFMYV